MDCIEFKSRLDAYIDNELSPKDRIAMLEHAQNCKDCNDELKYAEMLVDITANMPEEIVPPLEAQAAWREAVRKEARPKNSFKPFRGFKTIAAALVVLVGCVAVFGEWNNDAASPDSQVGEQGVFTYVAADGNETSPRSAASEEPGSAMTASAKLIADDIRSSSETVEGIVGDFGGYVDDVSVNDNAAYITAYVPGNELASFMESLEYIGDVESARSSGEGEGIVSVAITIKSE